MCSNKLEWFCTCQKQLNSYCTSKMDRFATISMPRKTQKALLAYAVETAGMLQHTICCDHQRNCHHLWTMALVDQNRSFKLMNWKRSSMQQVRKTTTWLSGFSRLTRLPTFATTVLRKPMKVHTNYTAKMFEIREYHLCHPKASFENIADTFGMPKTTIFNDKPSVEPARGRGNRKCTRRLLSYPQETEQQLVCLHVYVK